MAATSTKVGKAVDKQAEIAAADAHDATVWAEIEARMDLTWREKLVLAGQRFEPRLTDSMIEKHHARAKTIHETARDCLDWDAAPWQSCLKDWRNEMARQRKDASQDADKAPALLRVTKEKNRSAWSDERIAKLLNSTVYRGCFSQHRRWRPGPLIVRDHLYWAPLICLLCGMRPEEVLRLLKSDVFERDGILCFRVEQRPESGTKTESSERVVPLPETLLRLGFREWWHDSFYRPAALPRGHHQPAQRQGLRQLRQAAEDPLGPPRNHRLERGRLRTPPYLPDGARPRRGIRQRSAGDRRARAGRGDQPPLHRNQPRQAQGLHGPAGLRDRHRRGRPPRLPGHPSLHPRRQSRGQGGGAPV
jgi:integrase